MCRATRKLRRRALMLGKRALQKRHRITGGGRGEGTVCYYPPFAPHEFVTTFAACGQSPWKSVHFCVIHRRQRSFSCNFRVAPLTKIAGELPRAWREGENRAKGFAAGKTFSTTEREESASQRARGRAISDRSLARQGVEFSRIWGKTCVSPLNYRSFSFATYARARGLLNKSYGNETRYSPGPFRELHRGNFIEGFA